LPFMARHGCFHLSFMALLLHMTTPLCAGVRVVPALPAEFTLPSQDSESSQGAGVLSTLNQLVQDSLIQRHSGVPTAPLEQEVLQLCNKDATGAAIGCRSSCKCGWGQQCYPKWWHPEDQHISQHPEDRGVCETSMTVLSLSSFVIFTLVLISVVSLRTYLQWRALAEDDFGDHPPGFVKLSMLNATPKSQVEYLATSEKPFKAATTPREEIDVTDSEDETTAPEQDDDGDISKLKALSEVAELEDAQHEATQREAAEQAAAALKCTSSS